MGGGLMQLVAYGAQDIYLTGNPQITFFKVVYRRHTNFSMEAIKQTFNGTADFGNDVSATISRNGDLVYRMYLEHSCVATGVSDANIAVVEHYGHSLIKECEIEIGGQRIDKHTSLWNRVYSDLTEFNPSGNFGRQVEASATVAGNGTLYQRMTGNHISLNTAVVHDDQEFGICATGQTTGTVGSFRCTATGSGSVPGVLNIDSIFLPLNFWFNRNPGLALPLIALQYHEVKVKMSFETIANLFRNDVDNTAGAGQYSAGVLDSQITNPNFDLWCDYIYLDTDERRRFAQVSHEYLIEQLQYSDNTVTNGSPSIDLNFNHPVKELIWTSKNTGSGGRCSGETSGNADLTASPVSLETMGGNWQLKLNGHDRFKERDSRYFTRTQVWQHHTGYGATPTSVASNDDLGTDGVADGGGDSIAVYSFALKPEEHQPSGTCNFSRIDNAQLVGTTIVVGDAGDPNSTNVPGSSAAHTLGLTIFAVNYNVLRIMSGMGGLAYSN
tara:strand:- start:5490 stop:6983 length:1494 start_codon:yes stop_codon:yes gene_type:complete